MAGTIPEELAKLRARRSSGARRASSSATSESDIKGYDNFGKLCAAIDSMGLKDTLSGGEYTLLAPSDSAFEKHEQNDGTPLTADILKYHVIEGKVTHGSISGNQKCLGGELFYRRFARKTWLDDAIIGLKSEGPSKSSNWPSDVECSNGLIQRRRHGARPGPLRGAAPGCLLIYARAIPPVNTQKSLVCACFCI